jgi:hypothetical protein
MDAKTKSPRSSTVAFTIGRRDFARICEVEGIVASPALQKDFEDFDRKGLSAAARRRALAHKYGRKV